MAGRAPVRRMREGRWVTVIASRAFAGGTGDTNNPCLARPAAPRIVRDHFADRLVLSACALASDQTPGRACGRKEALFVRGLLGVTEQRRARAHHSPPTRSLATSALDDVSELGVHARIPAASVQPCQRESRVGHLDLVPVGAQPCDDESKRGLTRRVAGVIAFKRSGACVSHLASPSRCAARRSRCHACSAPIASCQRRPRSAASASASSATATATATA